MIRKRIWKFYAGKSNSEKKSEAAARRQYDLLEPIREEPWGRENRRESQWRRDIRDYMIAIAGEGSESN